MTLQELYNEALQLGATPESQVDFDMISVRQKNGKSIIRIS